jgi:hypothetical protein
MIQSKLNPHLSQESDNPIYRNLIKLKPLSIASLDKFLTLVSLSVECVWFVNWLVIVCLFISRWLGDKESKENGYRSPPRNGDGDQSTQDEDEDYFDFVKPGKPSFESYLNTQLTRVNSAKCPRWRT